MFGHPTLQTDSSIPRYLFCFPDQNCPTYTSKLYPRWLRRGGGQDSQLAPAPLFSSPGSELLDISPNFTLGGLDGEEVKTHSSLPHHFFSSPGSKLLDISPNFTLGGLEREEVKTHSLLLRHFFRLPGQNCSTYSPKPHARYPVRR